MKKQVKQLWKLIPALVLVVMIFAVGMPKRGAGDAGTKADAASKGILTQASNLNINYSKIFSPITEHKHKTIMLYLCGSNLESQNAAASLDLSEIMDTEVDIENCNVVVFTGGAKGWALDIPTLHNAVYLLTEDNGENTFSRVLKTTVYRDMASPTTLAFFLNFAYYSFPADEFDLILWDHGAAVTGFGCDEITRNLMGIAGIGNALDKSPFKGNRKLDWVAFDACMMASLEVAHVLKDHADYMIASEENMLGTGFDYSFLKTVSTKKVSGEKAGKAIIDVTYKFIVDLAQAGILDYVPEFTMSCIDLSKVDDVEDALESLAGKASGQLKDSFNKYSASRASLFEYGQNGIDTDTVDCTGFAGTWANVLPDESRRLTSAVDEAVTFNVAKRTYSTGLSLYNTYSATNKQFSYDMVSDIYKSIDVCPDYLSFMGDFKKVYDSGGDVDWTVSDSSQNPEPGTAASTTESTAASTTGKETQTTAQPSTSKPATTKPTTQAGTTAAPWSARLTPDTSGEHDIAITLTKEQAASVSKVYKVVFSDVSNVNGYGCTFLSSDVNIEGNKFTADFDVLSYQLNSNGKSIPIYLTEVQSVGDERIFEAYVEVCRTKSFDIHRAAYFRLRILFSNEYPDGKIIGLIPLHAEQSCAPIEIKDGYSIWTLDTYYKGVTRDENGRIQPMYQWEERGMLMSREVLEVKGGCTLTKDTKGEEGVSQYYHVCLLFQDTYGDAFMTEIVDLKPGRTREAAD